MPRERKLTLRERKVPKIKPVLAWVVMARNGYIYRRYGGDIIAGDTRKELAEHFPLVNTADFYVRVRITVVQSKKRGKK